MFRRVYDKLYRSLVVLCGVFTLLWLAPVVHASPFGQGVFGAHVPFGSVTSLSIALGGDVNLSLVPSGPTLSGSGSHTITITSTDVVGYGLYVYGDGNTNLSNGTDIIPASSNSSAAPLSVNTWGYNTDGSTNFVGLTTVPRLLKTAIGPYETGDDTTVSYGVVTDVTKSAGVYTGTVTYTVVALTD